LEVTIKNRSLGDGRGAYKAATVPSGNGLIARILVDLRVEVVDKNRLEVLN